jgi:hypothetical protein
MAAGEDEAQPVINHSAVGRIKHQRVLKRGEPLDLVPFLPEAGAPAQVVDCPMPRRADKLRARVRGGPLRGPLLERSSEGLLHHLLGKIEVVEEADQGGKDAPRFLSIKTLDVHQAAR